MFDPFNIGEDWSDLIYTKEQCEANLLELDKIYGAELGLTLEGSELRQELIRVAHLKTTEHTRAYENWVAEFGTYQDWFEN